MHSQCYNAKLDIKYLLQILVRIIHISFLYLTQPILFIAFLVSLALCLLPGYVTANATLEASQRGSSGLPEIRFLIVTPDNAIGETLSHLIKELYNGKVVIKSSEDYDMLIDEQSFDAFIYYGSDPSKEPGQNFVHDMERTSKPVLWINYHGWLLDEEFLDSKGVKILNKPDSLFVEIVMDDVYKIGDTHITYLQTTQDNILYYLRSHDGVEIPGAAVIDNYTFVTYAPTLDIFSPGFYPFLTAMQTALGDLTPSSKVMFANYQSRIQSAREDDYRTGIHLPVYIASTSTLGFGYENDLWHKNLVRIKQSGAEWVNLVRTFYQTDVRSSDVHADKQRTPSLNSLKNIVQDAHDLGLMVQIHLAINLNERGPEDWHGMIKPNNSQQWWENYQTIALETAEFARRNQVEALIIGTEYTGMQSYSDEWRMLIKLIRNKAQYEGLIGYEGNYNSLDIDWLDKVDFLGISAYWPLSKDRDPSPETLKQSWQRINKKLGIWMAKHPTLRVEFTEAGYTSQPYASVYPFSWKPHKGKAQSHTEQMLCYRSLYDFLKHEPRIKGIHIFASSADDDNPDSIGYTPFGKPAEKVMEQIMRIR